MHGRKSSQVGLWRSLLVSLKFLSPAPKGGVNPIPGTGSVPFAWLRLVHDLFAFLNFTFGVAQTSTFAGGQLDQSD